MARSIVVELADLASRDQPSEEEKAIVTPRSIAVVPRHDFVTGLIICLFVLV